VAAVTGATAPEAMFLQCGARTFKKAMNEEKAIGILCRIVELWLSDWVAKQLFC